MKKRVFYTCITDGYDQLLKHQWVDSRWDYVCFTDNPKILESEYYNGWKIRPLFFDHLDPHYNSRWHKIFPHLLFPEYESSLWIDASVNVLSSNVFEIIDKTDKKMLLPVHPWRDCIYAELHEVVLQQKVRRELCDLQEALLRSEGFPEHYGLSENGLMFRQHNDETVSRMMEQWWLMLLRFSRRDQTSLSFVLWKNGFAPADFAMPSIRPSLNYECEKHKVKSIPYFGKMDSIRGHRRRIYLFGRRVLSYKYKVSSYVAKRNVPSINFVTSTDETYGSTRLRVYRIAEGLKRRGFEVTINKNDAADIQVFQKSDPVFLKDRFIRAKRAGKFICFDIDDYHQSCYNFLLCHADWVIVCSEFLKRQYKSLNRNISILDNMIDVSEPVMEFPQYDLSSPKIGWFGNTTNLPALRRTGVKNVTTITQGGDIQWRYDTIDHELQKFDLILIPQEKTKVGGGKGNCRMLKTLYLGVPALVSDLESYVNLAQQIGYPSDFIMTQDDDWNQRIEEIKSGKRPFLFDFQQCHAMIEKYYSSEVIENHWISTLLFHYWNRKKITFLSRVWFYLNSFRPYQKRKSGDLRQITILGIFRFSYTKRKKR